MGRRQLRQGVAHHAHRCAHRRCADVAIVAAYIALCRFSSLGDFDWRTVVVPISRSSPKMLLAIETQGLDAFAFTTARTTDSVNFCFEQGFRMTPCAPRPRNTASAMSVSETTAMIAPTTTRLTATIPSSTSGKRHCVRLCIAGLSHATHSCQSSGADVSENRYSVAILGSPSHGSYANTTVSGEPFLLLNPQPPTSVLALRPPRSAPCPRTISPCVQTSNTARWVPPRFVASCSR